MTSFTYMPFRVVFFPLIIFIFSGCVDQSPAPIEYGTRDSAISSKPLNSGFDNDGAITSRTINETNLEDRPTEFFSAPREEDDLMMTPKSSLNDNSKIIYHEVQDGETLDSIASNYDKTPEELATFNELPYPCMLDEFQVIKIKVSNDLLNKKNKENISSVKNDETFIKPVSGGTIITRFGDKMHPGISKGINIAAKKGAEVKSVSAGTVVYAGNKEQFGNLLIIKTRNLYIAYAHLQDLILDKQDIVEKGQIIGHVGQKGDIPQIHFAIREGQEAVDPLKYIKFD